MDSTVMWVIVLCGLLAIVYAGLTARALMAADAGTVRMREIAAAIQEGAQAYLTRQYTTIAVAGVVIFVIVGLLLGWLVALGFLIGAVLSGAAGFAGMLVSVRANVRTAQAATKSLADGLSLAFRAGAVTGSRRPRSLRRRPSRRREAARGRRSRRRACRREPGLARSPGRRSRLPPRADRPRRRARPGRSCRTRGR